MIRGIVGKITVELQLANQTFVWNQCHRVCGFRSHGTVPCIIHCDDLIGILVTRNSDVVYKRCQSVATSNGVPNAVVTT